MDPRRLLPALAALALLCVVLTVVATLTRGGSGLRRDEATPLLPASPGPAEILAQWDEQRSSAWAVGDTGALRELYAVGSDAGAADVRLLQRYLDRGLRVTGLRTQVLSLHVLDREDTRLSLEITDRIVGGEAVGRDEPVPLPADRASSRRIELVKVGEEWLVVEVRDQASADASTSRTSSSSKS